MSLKQEKKSKKQALSVNTERRGFLKKTAYAAPTIMALGHLARPTNAMAESIQAINNDPNLGPPGDFW